VASNRRRKQQWIHNNAEDRNEQHPFRPETKNDSYKGSSSGFKADNAVFLYQREAASPLFFLNISVKKREGGSRSPQTEKEEAL